MPAPAVAQQPPAPPRATSRSCLYRGWVRHRRVEPREHAFRYRVFMLMLDLDELDTVFDQRWLWSSRRPALARFKRSDYFGSPDVPLADAIRDLVRKRTGSRPRGPITVLTNLRYFGYVSNPVTFYYCWSLDGSSVETVVAEITNTPWGERHQYVLGTDDNIGSASKLRFRFDKEFHVSPFMPMQQSYDWRFTIPGEGLVIHMDNIDNGRSIFDATMRLERRPITGIECAKALLSHPCMTAKATAGIYWNALRLRMKRITFHPHPKLSAKQTKNS